MSPALCSPRLIVSMLSLVWGLASCSFEAPTGEGPLAYQVIDKVGPADPWGKAVGDLNDDGLPDWVVGGHARPHPSIWRSVLVKLGLFDGPWPDQGELVWYQSPGMERHLISDGFRFRTDLEVVDVNGDGRQDVVAVTDQGLVWFQAPAWVAHVVDTRMLHDVEVADLDGDGDQDLVARDQTLFGHDSGDLVHVYRQQADGSWRHEERRAPQGEGLKVVDMNGDGLPDAVVNQHWYVNPGTGDPISGWVDMTYCPTWDWPHAYLDVRDMNNDGRPDIVMAPAEPVGRYFRLSWCDMAAEQAGKGVERVVDDRVETVMHSVVAGDFDLDGRVDLVTAQMFQGLSHEDVALYSRAADQSTWLRTVIGTTGSHSMKAADVDGDGDLDLLGANWSGDHQPVDMWLNTSTRRTAPGWRRHVIDDAKPWRSVFLTASDLNGDGLKDIVTGGWWYHNPGSPGGPWVRHDVGPSANNMALVADLDGDGDQDILSSTWDDAQWTLPQRMLVRLGLRTWYPEGGLVWAQNDGAGRFRILNQLAPGEGDFLQGAALLEVPGGVPTQLVTSWHRAGQGLQQWQVPSSPAQQWWPRSLLSQESQDEALTATDLDGDGVADLLLGTRWMKRSTSGGWSVHVLHPTPLNPDRNRAGDINGDGQTDVVIGYEAVSRPGKLAWYQRGDNPLLPWTEHPITTLTGPMSLDLADMDHDGDLDVVVGEHNLRRPFSARLLWLENRDGRGRLWVERGIYTGDEHHDGAQVVDIDNDGDLDVVSIGWGHDRVAVYENLAQH